MSDTLILALPSKGRLMEAAEAYFLEAGLKIQRHGGMRRYQGAIKPQPGHALRTPDLYCFDFEPKRFGVATGHRQGQGRVDHIVVAQNQRCGP